MDFHLTPEEESVRMEVERFAREELLPLEPLFERAPDIFNGSRWKSRAKLSADPEIKRYIEIMEDLERKAEARGLWDLDIPKRFGGREVSNVAMIAATEELERTSVPFELGNHVSNILYACQGEQIERFLLPCIRGEKTACFVLTEPGAGSDPSMMATTATPDGDSFVLNGNKVFPTFADVADIAQVFARLPGTRGHEGISCFLVEKGTPGYRVVRSIATIAGTEPCEIVFENCRVPKDQVLGEVGKGWELNQAWLGARRFQVGIRCHGTARRVLRMVGKSLRDDRSAIKDIAASLGALLGDLEALRSLTYFGAWKADQGLDVRADAAGVKLFGTELLHRAVDFALEVMGPSAYRKDRALARAFRHARATRIVEGASEIQRHIIQRALFRTGSPHLELLRPLELRLTEEEKLIRNTAAQFVAKELLPLEGSFLKQQAPFLPPGDPPRRELEPELRTRLSQKAKDVGLWLTDLPEEHGGAGVGHVARILIHREFGQTALPFQPLPIPPVISDGRLIRDLTDGGLSVSLAFDEVHRTGDAGELRARYRATPGGYRLDSPPVELLDPQSDLFILPARGEGSGDIGLFLLEKGLAGLAVDEEADLTSDQTVARLTIEGCEVGAKHLVGEEEDLHRIIAGEQLRLAARSLGMGMRSLADSLEHARGRVTFGRPLASRQAIQWMVADLSIKLRAATWLTMEAACKADQGLPYFEAAALAKRTATRMAFEAADTAIQIHGGYGVCREFPFESFYRHARLMRLLYGREREIDRKMGERFLTGC